MSEWVCEWVCEFPDSWVAHATKKCTPMTYLRKSWGITETYHVHSWDMPKIYLGKSDLNEIIFRYVQIFISCDLIWKKRVYALNI